MPEAQLADEMNFLPCPHPSIGIELELQLVRAHDLDLARDAERFTVSEKGIVVIPKYYRFL